MKKSATIFLQVVLVMIGIVVVALLLWEPRVEGRNVNATNIEIYFHDPFLALVYAGSIPFFIALYQAFKLLGQAGRDRIFSKEAVKSLRMIRYCALAIIGFVAVELAIILLNRGNDDAAGGVAIGVFIAFGSIVVATAATLFERTLQSAVDIKSENDLTV